TLYSSYGEAFPPAYVDDFPARNAVYDIQRMEDLAERGGLNMNLYRPLEASPGTLRFKLFWADRPLPLSDAVPMLEDMGVRVVEERPYELHPAGHGPVWIHDFGIVYTGPEGDLDISRVRDIFQEAFAAILRGEAESDGFNRLVLRARLTWRQIVVLRAYCKYLRQTRLSLSQEYMEQALANNPQIARWLVELFESRFDPTQPEDAEAPAEELRARLGESIDQVANLDEDRILRSFLGMVEASLRTNFYQTGLGGQPKPYLSFKLDPTQVPSLPKPRPMFEVFVYSPRTEAVHLRGGRVARGGIRWSDRREDFRTEILGLMKAQMVKNAVIVPVGAKGGFVVKRPPTDGGREALMDEVVACYSTMMRGLLDITDNRVDGKVVGPADVVRYDDDDPYLVVAADKGTATFSDIANEISVSKDFWLGDAFASGGSAGYDHKKMGITARGAWESVKKHFRDLGTDT
ncbi:MAG: NAD-glutamate dehydrogenase domain-containing protein, partial [Actinomycetota bacterium]